MLSQFREKNSVVLVFYRGHYGLLNPKGKGWPHPATHVIDKQGIVRRKFVEVDYKVHPTNDMIIQALAPLP